MEGEAEERAELWHHPQPFLQRNRHQNKTERAERGGAKNKEMRHRDVQHNVEQKADKMNKLELLRKIKAHRSEVIHVKFDKENNSLPHLLLM